MTTTTERVYATLTGDTLEIRAANGRVFEDGAFDIGQVRAVWAGATGHGEFAKHWLCMKNRAKTTLRFAMPDYAAAMAATRQVKALWLGRGAPAHPARIGEARDE